MPYESKTLIMKFGGAAVQSTESFSRIADLILSRKASFERVVVVVSAMGDMTDTLISMALEVNPSPPRREYDMLVSVGERISISLLAMALAGKGVQAVSYTGSQSGVITCDSHSAAKILGVRPYRLLNSLAEGKVVIVAGFQGVSESKEITTLGRGGSDTSAVALAAALQAEKVEFYKDVPGICSVDPRVEGGGAIFPELGYREALDVALATGGQILHPRALILAEKNGIPLHVRSFVSDREAGTLIPPASHIQVRREPSYEA